MAEGKKEESIEYSIIVHNHPNKIKEGAGETEKIETMTNMDKAFEQAEELVASGEYHKVEVKKKYFEEKTQRTLDMTLKVFENRPKKGIGVVTLTIIAVLCGALAFGGAYFIGQMSGS
jgi:GTPase